MSMIGNLRRLSDEDLSRLFDSPELIETYLYEEEEGERDDRLGPYVDMDIDKAWHGLHFLLTGGPSGGPFPLGFLLAGGTPVGEEDVGYGPARGFCGDEVKQIAKALQQIDRSALAAGFDGQAMTQAEIYPDIWDRAEERTQNVEYLLRAFDSVRLFLTAAAKADEALLVYLN
jgi:hypothetical protein